MKVRRGLVEPWFNTAWGQYGHGYIMGSRLYLAIWSDMGGNLNGSWGSTLESDSINSKTPRSDLLEENMEAMRLSASMVLLQTCNLDLHWQQNNTSNSFSCKVCIAEKRGFTLCVSVLALYTLSVCCQYTKRNLSTCLATGFLWTATSTTTTTNNFVLSKLDKFKPNKDFLFR